jgi:ribosomal protein L11 methyltransferase
MKEPRYPLVLVNVAADDAEEVGARLFELGALGVEQRDGVTLIRSTAPEGRVVLVASFATDGEAQAAVAEAPPDWSARLGEVVGDEWRDEWKKHFEPFVLCRSADRAVVVRPPWRSYDAAEGDVVIVLEPGRAFGTGLHETTRLVAEVLAEHSHLLRGAAVLDVGCGSGILALTALALGAAAARAVDIDADAVAVTRENAERNGWDGCVHADDARVDAMTAQYSVVLANIEARPLVGLAPFLAARVAPGGLLVLSGVLSTDVAPSQWEDVRQAYATLEVLDVKREGEWIAAVLRR